jgi:hypothetical protein
VEFGQEEEEDEIELLLDLMFNQGLRILDCM